MQRSLNTLLSNKNESHPLNIKDIVSYRRITAASRSQSLNTYDYYFDHYTNKIIFIINTAIKICGKSLKTVIKSVNIDNLFQSKEYTHNDPSKQICFIHSNNEYNFLLLCYEIYSEYYVNVIDIQMTTVIQRIKSVSDKNGFKGGFFFVNDNKMFCLVLSNKFIVLSIKQQHQQRNTTKHEVVPVGKNIMFGNRYTCDKFYYDQKNNMLIILSNDYNEYILIYDMNSESTWSTPYKINIPYDNISLYAFKRYKGKRNSIGSNIFTSQLSIRDSFNLTRDNSITTNTRNYSTADINKHPIHIYFEQIYKYKYIIILDLIQLKILLYRLEQVSKITLTYVILISDDAILRTASYNSNDEVSASINGVLHFIDNLIIFHNVTNELTYVYDVKRGIRNDCYSDNNNNNNQKRETFLICKPFKVNVKYFYDNINHGNIMFVNNIVVSIDENVKSISKLQFDCVKYFDYGSNDNRSIVDAINVIFQRKNYKQCILNILKCSLCVDNNNINNNVIIPSSQMYVIHFIIEIISFKISLWNNNINNNNQSIIPPSKSKHFKTKYLLSQEDIYKLLYKSFQSTTSPFNIQKLITIIFLFNYSLQTKNINLNPHFYSLLLSHIKSNIIHFHKYISFFNFITFIPPSPSIIDLFLTESKSTKHTITMRKYFKQQAYDMLYNSKMYCKLLEELLNENKVNEAMMILHTYKDELIFHKDNLRSVFKQMLNIKGNVILKKLLLCSYNNNININNNYIYYDFN